MPKLFICFLAVLVLVALVALAPLALLYFVFARFCDLTETFFDALPWATKRPKSKVKGGLGLSTLRDIFSKLQHGNAKNSL